MDAIVTARVPVELKEQGNDILRSIGSNPTQLINSAYRFVLKEKRLPGSSESLDKVRGKHRKLSQAQASKLRNALNAMQLGCIDDDESFRDQLNNVRDDRYADIA